ncbi:hypothetical protein CRUP_027798 [Coryphaenoides rupestris]|nr:hypothetical protein CRUP_027798 [Coryphaenoides rupestris]
MLPCYVLSPVISQRDGGGDSGCSVKVSIEISDSQEPVTFTCDVSSPVELLISQTLCWVHDDLDQVDFSSYLLKAEDETSPIDLEMHLALLERPFKENVTRQGLADYLEGYHKQVNICLQNESTQYKTVERVAQTVKNLCSALDAVETQPITEAIKRLRHQANLPRTRSPEGTY